MNRVDQLVSRFEGLFCFSSAFWEIINCWNYLGCKGPEIVYLYSKYGIDAEISKLYDEYLGGHITSKRLVTEVHSKRHCIYIYVLGTKYYRTDKI